MQGWKYNNLPQGRCASRYGSLTDTGTENGYVFSWNGFQEKLKGEGGPDFNIQKQLKEFKDVPWNLRIHGENS